MNGMLAMGMDRKYIKKKRRRETLGFWLVVLMLPLSIFILDGQQRLVVSHYDCPVSGLPDEFEDFCIVQLSDLHGAKFGVNNNKLLTAVRRQSPDLIALTGDFVEEPTDLKVTASLLPELVKIAPCYFITGNHEWASGEMSALREQLEQSGVEYLSNEYCTLTRGEGTIVLCGVEDPNSWADLVTPDILVEEAALCYPEMPIILLGHRNYWVEEYPGFCFRSIQRALWKAEAII